MGNMADRKEQGKSEQKRREWQELDAQVKEELREEQRQRHSEQTKEERTENLPVPQRIDYILNEVEQEEARYNVLLERLIRERLEKNLAKKDDGSMKSRLRAIYWRHVAEKSRKKREERNQRWTREKAEDPIVRLADARMQESASVAALAADEPDRAEQETRCREENLKALSAILQAIIDASQEAIRIRDGAGHYEDGREAVAYPWLDRRVRLYRDQFLRVGSRTAEVISAPELTELYRKLFVNTWDIAHNISSDHMADNLYKFRMLETVQDRDILEERYVRHIFPAISQEESSRPLVMKAVYLQPRRKINPSATLVCEALGKDPDVELHVHELFWNIAPRCYCYLMAENFVRDAVDAQIIFFHETTRLLGGIHFRKEQRVVQLWHGCGVLKKLGLDLLRSGAASGYYSVKHEERFPMFKDYSLVTLPGEAEKSLFSRFMGIPEDSGSLQPIGVSRTDVFFDESYRKNARKLFEQRIPAARGKKVILYAPTYRGKEPYRKAPDALDIRAFRDALGADWILVIKHHQTAHYLPPIPDDCQDTFAFDLSRNMTEPRLNINQLMMVSDVIISDYSSVVYEFALLGRPILSFVYDYDKYRKNPGVYEDFLADVPGPKCRTNQEMIDYIRGLPATFDREEVAHFREKYMSGCDGHATERIVRYMKTGDME